MKLINAWLNLKSAFIGIIVFIAVMLWPAIPLRGLNVWFQTLINLFPTNIFYPILAFLSASYTALFIYIRENNKICKVKPETAAKFSLIGVLLGACPACIPAIAFFLPISITITLSYFSWIFLTISILLLLFAIYKVGGFKKEEEKNS